VEKETESSNRDEPFEIDWSAHEGEDASESASPDAGAAPSAVDLPVAPPLPWEQEPDSGYDAKAVLADLIDFYLYGRRGPHAVPDAAADRPIPALLYRYRDLDDVRHAYPICLLDSGDTPVRTLTEVIDAVTSRVVEQGEVGERRRRHLLRLEGAIRRKAGEAEGERLRNLWEQAAKEIVDDAPVGDKRDLLRQSFDAARGALDVDGVVLPCAPSTPRRLFMAVVDASWNAKCARWREELQSLLMRTENILGADDNLSASVNSPEHLRDAAGGEDMNFDTMSSLLKESNIGEPLAESRRERIRRALEAIKRVVPLFDGSVSLLDAGAKLPFDLQPVLNVTNAAVERHAERMRTMVEFFKAIRIAELEASNRYREDVHDRFFAQFDTSRLTAEELSFCPPVVLVLDRGFFASPDIAGLFDLLSAGLPVKVFAELDDVTASGGAACHPSSTPAWSTRLAAMAAQLNHVAVVQAPASMPAFMCSGFAKGFNHNGPALAVAYTGNTETQPGLPLYLSAASAVEARVFPAFCFDPSAGATLADRMSVAENPHADSEWPTDTFEYCDDRGDAKSTELEFTPADFISLDVRFEAHFWCVDPSRWHKNMVLLSEYLREAPGELADRVPYLSAVDAQGNLARVVVTHDVVDMVCRVALHWRNVQESGGINNSFAESLVADEKMRLHGEKEQEVAEIEKKYAADLDRDLSDLTREIVARIAAQLMAEDASALLPRAPAPPQAPAPAAPAQVAVEVVEEEEEEEAASFDDPYIDTPLCTSCNDCTKINSKFFAYDDNKQAYIADASAATFREIVTAAEKCPVKIIHPGKPRDPSEPGLDDLIKRAEPFN